MFNSVFLDFFFLNVAGRTGEREGGRKEEKREGGAPTSYYTFLGTELTFKEHSVKGSAAEDFSPISKAL